MTDKMDRNENGNSDITLRDAAEEKLGKLPAASPPELKNPTYDKIDGRFDGAMPESLSGKSTPGESKASNDLIVLSILSIVTLAIAVRIDLLQKVIEWAIKYENWEVDEFLTFWIILAVSSAIFAVRRWRESRHELTRRLQAEVSLQRSHDELEALVAKRTKELHDGKKRLSHILASNPAILYTARTDHDFAATFISYNVTAQLGYEPREFLEDPTFWANHIHPEDAPLIFAKMPALFEQGHQIHEYRFPKKDGKYRWMRDELQLIRDGKGTPIEIVGFWIDITDRKQAEESLRITDKAVRTAINGIGFATPDGCLFFANEAWLKMWGFHKPDEAIGLHISEFVEDKNEFSRKFKTFLEKGSIIQEMRARRKDGTIFDVQFAASSVLDDRGKPLCIMASFVDVSERKLAEEQGKRLITAIEHAAEGVVITDAKGIIQYVNPAEEKISGYSSAELIGQGADIFKSDKHTEDFYTNMWDSINSGEVWSGRFINRKKDGTEYYEDASISPVYDKSENLTNFVAVKHDVTKQISLQEQLFQAQKMEAIGTLAGGFAHDFNNLLQVILGHLDMIQSDPSLPEQIQSSLNDIERAATSGAALIKGMMAFSRKTSVNLEPLNLNKLVAQAGSMLGCSIPKMIEINLLLAHDLWTINGDATQVGQILINLAINARDAMPDGGRLTIETKNVVLDEDYCRSYPNTKPGRYVRLSVTNSGIGIDHETVKHIFEPFFTTKAPGKGTGLGLYVVYGIVEKHGGRIICFSEPNEGTTFRIYFPAIEEIPEEQYSKKTEPPKGQGETILLVDDEPDFRELVGRKLSRANYSVIKASNGKEALNLYEQHREHISLVILDLLMPVMDGKRCLEALRNMDSNVRVLIATGHTTLGMAGELEQAGARGFIRKPFDSSLLLEEIRKIIDEE